MIKQIRLRHSSDHQTYFSSDWHLGHSKPWIVEKRGFKTIGEHDTALIDQINSQARVQDTIVFVGDFCLNSPLSKFQEYISRIQCQNIIMVAGNHNNPWWKFYLGLVREKYGEEIEVYPFTYRNVIFVGESLDIHINGAMVHAGHFPKSIWDMVKHGAVHVCGHSHSSYPETLPEFPNHKRLDVGFDVFGKLLPFDELERIMAKKAIIKLDHH